MKDIIKSFITNSTNNKITYAEYMNQVLYHSELGYYMKEKQKIGKAGDFFTSSSVHSVFGNLFARIFSEMIDKENLPAVICEVGGGDGRFAQSVLDEWYKIADQTLTYYIVESSPYHRKLQSERVSNFKEVKHFASMEDLKDEFPSFQGILFSNELFDAFPVHVIERKADQIDEVFVTINKEGELSEHLEKCNNSEVIEWHNKYGPPLSEGQRIEVPLQMESWLRETVEWVERGVIITIDYGYTKKDWQQPERMDGSLRGYYQHRLINNPLMHPGDMDLTTHIHLDAFEEIAEEEGLTTIISTSQNRFLLSAGILDYLQDNYDPNPFSEKSKLNRAIRSLITDGGMSSAFHVIVQGKNLVHCDTYSFVKENPFT